LGDGCATDSRLGFFKGLSPSRGQFFMSPAHVTDVATAFVRAVEDSSLYEQVIELGGPEALSWSGMLGRIADACETKKWVVPMPIGLMQVVAFLLDWMPGFPVTRDHLTMLAEGNTVEGDALSRLIDGAPIPFTIEQLGYLKS
jgi:NADH dehydrogenase